MVTSFNKTFLDIINCNIPNKEATINDKYAPWITAEVKQAIKKKHCVLVNGNKLVNLTVVRIL